jgi:RNA polymerase sigma factor for flagellar operon FliA
MNPADLFAASTSLIDRITGGVCRRARLVDADAEDFASDVRLALLQDDYAVLRKFEGRSSLQSFLSVVIERLFFDRRTRMFGRWFPSAKAERMGTAAVLLETLLTRDRRSLEQALPIVLDAHPALTRTEIDEIVARLPERTSRPRPVPIDAVSSGSFVAVDSADARTLAAEASAVAERTSAIVRETLAALPLEDRMIIRMHFGTSMTVAEISRVTRLPQRPLYRRIEALMQQFRRAFTAAGVDPQSVIGLIGTVTAEMNFALRPENGISHQSNAGESPATEETG